MNNSFNHLKSKAQYSYLFLLMAVSFMQAQEQYKAADIPLELLKNANSVVRFEHTTVDIPTLDKMIIATKQVITVLNKSGNRHVEACSYYDDYTKIKKVEVTYLNANGKELRTYKKRDFVDASAVDGGTLYSDNRMLCGYYTPADYPYTVIFETEVETQNTAGIPSFYPVVDYLSSTQESKFDINYGADVTLKLKHFNPQDVISFQSKQGGYSLSLSNYKAIFPETYGPSRNGFVPHIIFGLEEFYLAGVKGNAKDWQSFGAWMDTYLLDGTAAIPEKTKQEVKQLVASESTNRGKAKKVYEYMQDRTRYISVQLGLGGWKPMPAAEVDDLGYGDCKALTNYTKSLLAAVDVPSYYTVVNAGNNQTSIMSEFTSMQGNHVILAVPEGDDYMWLECTSQTTPFDFNGAFTDNREVLLITPEGGKIVNTRHYAPDDNYQINKGVLEVKADGSISAQITMKSGGLQYDNKAGIEVLTAEKQDLRYKDYWDYINNISIYSINLTDNRDEIEYTEEVTFEASSYTSKAGADLILNVNAFNRRTFIPKRYKNRELGVKIIRGFKDYDEIEIKLPEGYTLEEVPAPKEIDSPYGVYKSSITKKDDSTLIYTREYTSLEGSYPKEKYADYRSFRRQITKFDNQKIILKSL